MHTTKWPTGLYVCTNVDHRHNNNIIIVNNASNIDIVVAIYCLAASYPLTEMQIPITTNLDPLFFVSLVHIHIFRTPGPYISEIYYGPCM